MKISLHVKTTVYAGKDASGGGIYHDIDANAEADTSEFSPEECAEMEIARVVCHAIFHTVVNLLSEQSPEVMVNAMRAIGYGQNDDYNENEP